MPALDPETFYRELVAHRLIVPTAVQGAFGRGAEFEDVLNRLDAFILHSGMAAGENVEPLTFPPVIDRAIIERTGYMNSFPHLCGTVHTYTGAEKDVRTITQRIEAGESWGELLEMTDVVLSPAPCYPFYPTCAGTLSKDGRQVTMMGWVYRHEPSPEPTRMRSFRIREFVRIGAPQVAVEWRDEWLKRGVVMLASLGLPVRTDVAADPFFGRAGRVLADSQLEQQLKFEVVVPITSEENPTACCSFNYHQNKFGIAFGIRTPDGEIAHSACLGFGLERVTMALFKTHGFKSALWPSAVRDKLWT